MEAENYFLSNGTGAMRIHPLKTKINNLTKLKI